MSTDSVAAFPRSARWIGLAVCVFGLAGPAAAAPVPADPAARKRLEKLYADLARYETRLRAALALAATPRETVAFLADVMRPVRMDAKKVDGWIGDLGSVDENEWRPAMKRLTPLAALPAVQTKLWNALRKGPTGEPLKRTVLVTLHSWLDYKGKVNGELDPADVPAANISVTVWKNSFQWSCSTGQVGAPVPRSPTLSLKLPEGDCEQPQTYRPWFRDATAVEILEHIGTPKAVAVLKDLATGHPDALPTKAAKEALARLTRPGP